MRKFQLQNCSSYFNFFFKYLDKTKKLTLGAAAVTIYSAPVELQVLGKGNERRKILFTLLRSVRTRHPLSHIPLQIVLLALKPRGTFKRDLRQVFIWWLDTVKNSLSCKTESSHGINNYLLLLFPPKDVNVPGAPIGCFGCECRQQSKDSKA